MATYDPPAHRQVLEAAIRLCVARGGWRFTPDEIVRALPHINASTVRTHVVSRCCANAPDNHPHTWDYFRRASRGVYEVRPAYRPRSLRRRRTRVAERAATYGTPDTPLRDTIHAVVVRSTGWYVGECLEVAVTTQGRTLDELVANLREAVALHLEDDDARLLGLVARPRIAVSYELPAR